MARPSLQLILMYAYLLPLANNIATYPHATLALKSPVTEHHATKSLFAPSQGAVESTSASSDPEIVPEVHGADHVARPKACRLAMQNTSIQNQLS